MQNFKLLLWATDKLELGNIGARMYIKFSIHTPKSDLVSFYEESYSFESLVDNALRFVKANSKNNPVATKGV